MSELSKFQDRLDALGADLGRWPARERAWAHALTARSTDARALLRAAEAFDRALAGAVPDARTDRLRASIMAALPARAAVGAGRMARSLWWLWPGGLAGAAASMAISFYAGAVAQDTVWPQTESTEVAAPDDAAGGTLDDLLFGFVLDSGAA
ncbi:MAG: hypothetical protein R3F55_17355 [Alphaproteobacteria bacterium]